MKWRYTGNLPGQLILNEREDGLSRGGVSLKEVSVIVPWRGRDELARTLRENGKRFDAVQAEVVVVNGGGEISSLRELIRDSGRERVRVVNLSDMEPFNKSACLNVGALHASGETLFTLDADVIVDSSFLEDASEAIEAGDCFVIVAETHENDPKIQADRWNPESKLVSQRQETRMVAENGNVATWEYASTRDGVRTGPGNLGVSKKDFLAVGGLNSQLVGWGFEDYDFQIRLQLGLGLKRRTMGRITHLSHAYGGARTTLDTNKSTAMKNYAIGEYMGSYETDQQTWGGVTPEYAD